MRLAHETSCHEMWLDGGTPCHRLQLICGTPHRWLQLARESPHHGVRLACETPHRGVWLTAPGLDAFKRGGRRFLEEKPMMGTCIFYFRDTRGGEGRSVQGSACLLEPEDGMDGPLD